MLVPERFYKANAWLCFAVGGLFNGALLWLIAKHSDAEMRPFSPILLFSTLLDLCYLVAIAVVVPIVLVDGERTAVISLGPLRWLPQPYSFALIVAWDMQFGFSLWTQCVPFIYRYMLICHGKDYGLKQFLAIFSLPAAVTVVFMGILFSVGYPRTEQEQMRAQEFLAGSNISDIVVGYYAEGSNSVAVPIYAFAATILDYALVFIFGWAIWRHLKRQIATNKVSVVRARELNEQVSIALLLQSLVPLAVENLPALVLDLLMGLGSGLPLEHCGAYMTAVFSWAPVLSPLVSMWVIRAYRRQVGKWLTLGLVRESVTQTTGRVMPLSLASPGVLSASNTKGQLQTIAEVVNKRECLQNRNEGANANETDTN